MFPKCCACIPSCCLTHSALFCGVEHGPAERRRIALAGFLAVVGPGVITGFAGNEAGELHVRVADNGTGLPEGFAIEDTLHPDRMVFGVTSAWAEEQLRLAFKPVLEQGVPTVVTADTYGAGEADVLLGRSLAGLDRSSYTVVGAVNRSGVYPFETLQVNVLVAMCDCSRFMQSTKGRPRSPCVCGGFGSSSVAGFRCWECNKNSDP